MRTDVKHKEEYEDGVKTSETVVITRTGKGLWGSALVLSIEEARELAKKLNVVLEKL